MNKPMELNSENLQNQLSGRSLEEAQPFSQNQLSSRSLEDSAISFNTLREYIEGLDPKTIQPITSIPEYVDPANCTNPVVVKTSCSIYCVEGWSRVKQALEAKQSMLTCHIYHMNEVSEEELAIRKVAIRVVPQGGVDIYAERVRNIRILFNMLSKTRKNPIVFSHGGVRKGKVFSNNQEDNILLVLAERLGKSPTTISKYLNHAKYLNDEALANLAQARVGKEFFEEVQILKRMRERNLISSGAMEKDIVAQISQDMVRMSQDSKEIDTLRAALTQAPDDIDSEEDFQKDEQAQENMSPPRSFNYWQGNGKLEEEQSSNENDFRTQGVEIAEKIVASFRNANLSLGEIKEVVGLKIQNLAMLLQTIGQGSEEDFSFKEAA